MMRFFRTLNQRFRRSYVSDNQSEVYIYRHRHNPRHHSTWASTSDVSQAPVSRLRSLRVPSSKQSALIPAEEIRLILLLIKYPLSQHFHHTATIRWEIASHCFLSIENLQKLCSFLLSEIHVLWRSSFVWQQLTTEDGSTYLSEHPGNDVRHAGCRTSNEGSRRLHEDFTITEKPSPGWKRLL